MDMGRMMDWDRVEQLVVDGYITKRSHDVYPLWIFNYTPKAQFDGVWCEETLECRGLITDHDYNIVAHPFRKFFNWLEHGERSSGHIVGVTEKIDGSLGILYKYNGEYSIATRGSFHSEQALWATNFLRSNFDVSGVDDDLTLLFEIVFPENRVVVDYAGRKDLVLLSARNRVTGKHIPFYPGVYILSQKHGFSTPKVYTFNNIEQIIERTGAMDASEEGFVVEFSDGQRFKFKGDRYIELHRLISGLSFKHTLEAMAGGSVEEIRSQVPDEFLSDFKRWEQEIIDTRDSLVKMTELAFESAPKETRKDYALWVNANHKALAPYLFAMMDGKDIVPMIYKMAFQNRKEELLVGPE